MPTLQIPSIVDVCIFQVLTKLNPQLAPDWTEKISMENGQRFTTKVLAKRHLDACPLQDTMFHRIAGQPRG